MARPSSRAAARLRPARSDDLGLRRALADRLLPMLVGAMAFLAALALAGVVAAAALGEHWRHGAAASLTVQVPEPARDGRAEAVLAVLRADPAVAEARLLSDAEMDNLLRPWLGAAGSAAELALPAVIAVRLRPSADPTDDALPPGLPPGLAARLDAAAPGTLAEAHDRWIRRLAVLARSLQACAALAMATVAAVAVAVVAVATRAGLSTRRDAIEIVHGLGATDGFIAARFARRATRLAASGAAGGALLALPVLLGLAVLAAPFAGVEPPSGFPALLGALPGTLLGAMPLPLWLGLPLLPPLAAAIGWVTAQVTVRRWLRRLP